MANWYLENYNGKLAVALNWAADKDEPTESRDLWVHPTEKYNEDYYKKFTQITLRENNVFSCLNSYTYQSQMLYTHDWNHVIETRSIPKPGRGGKNWKWEWSSWSRKWIKSNK